MNNDDNGIVRCPRCKKHLIAEEIQSHECLASVKQIPVVFFYTLKKGKEEIVIAKGYDGILYRLVKSPNNQSSTSKTTHSSTPKNDTPEDDRTKKINLISSKLWIISNYDYVNV